METFGGIVVLIMGFALLFGGIASCSVVIDNTNAVTECEKNMPRNQECKMIAVPVTEETK